jgi:protein-disulfide isomerase
MGKEKKSGELLSQKEEQERIESLVLAEKPEEAVEILQVNSPAGEKKIKNLISAVILLAGLFVGSLFVDTVQLFRGGGFSQRALDKTDVFSSNGKTWVAYTDPIVTVQVVNDSTCGDPCKPDEVLVGLKQAIPTMLTQEVDANSAQGKKIIAQFSLKTLPAFIFSKEIEKTDLFSKAQQFLDKQGDSYAIKSAEAGFPIGEYLAAPTIGDNDIKIGSNDAKVKVVEFSDFANPTDAQFYKDVISPMLKDYGDKIQFSFKNYFMPNSTQSLSAALASECANEQGKFLPYAEKLYNSQTAWNKLKDATSMLESYASGLGLNSGSFNQCLTSKKYNDQLTQVSTEGQSFGVNATPSIFIGSDLQVSTAKYDDIKKAIDGQLAQ